MSNRVAATFAVNGPHLYGKCGLYMYSDSWFVGFSFGRHRKASAKSEYGIDYDNNQNCWAEAISERAVAAANMVSKTKNENTNEKKANHSAHSMGSMRMEIKMKMAKWQAKHPLKQSEKGEQRKPPLRIHFTKRQQSQKRGREAVGGTLLPSIVAHLSFACC